MTNIQNRKKKINERQQNNKSLKSMTGKIASFVNLLIEMNTRLCLGPKQKNDDQKQIVTKQIYKGFLLLLLVEREL